MPRARQTSTRGCYAEIRADVPFCNGQRRHRGGLTTDRGQAAPEAPGWFWSAFEARQAPQRCLWRFQFDDTRRVFEDAGRLSPLSSYAPTARNRESRGRRPPARRTLPADRQGHQPERGARRGARLDRRIGLRQDYGVARLTRLRPARLPHLRWAGAARWRGRAGARALRAAAAPRAAGGLCRPERGRCLQSSAHHRRSGDGERAHTQAHEPGRGQHPGARALPPSRAAGPREPRPALPASSERRPAPAADGGDGHELGTGAAGARRADHCSRCHHSDRGAERFQRDHPPTRHRGHLRDP